MEQLFEINLQLKDGPVASTSFPLNQIISGKITIKPFERIEVDYIGYHLMAVEQKKVDISLGVLDSFRTGKNAKKILSTKYLTQNCLLSEYEPYRYAIRFINNEVETYAGINTNFSIKVQVFIKVNKKAISAKNTSFFNQLNPATKLPKDGIYKEDFYLIFRGNAHDYRLITKRATLRINTQNPLKTAFVIAIVALFFFAAGTKLLFESFLIAIPVGIVSLFYYYRYSLLGEFTIEYEQLDNKYFLFKIKNDSWRTINEISTNYEIRETVQYPSTEHDDGIETEILYTSPEHSFENPKSTIIVKNEFPEDLLGTTEMGATSIYWIALIYIHTNWGFDLPLEHRFVVRKKVKRIRP